MIRFSPAPGLSLTLVPVLIILIALGAWQVKRLQWKTELLAQISHGEILPPMALSDLLAQEERGKFIAWRKAAIFGRIADEPVRPLYSIRYGRPALRALAPFITDDGVVITVDFGYLDGEPKPGFRLARTGQALSLAGILKPIREPGPFAPKNQANGVWYWPDTARILSPFFANKAVETYVLDLEGTPLHPDWPEPAPSHADIPNNHLDYALTWFGLALAAFGIYLGWHVRNGRLYLVKKQR